MTLTCISKCFSTVKRYHAFIVPVCISIIRECLWVIDCYTADVINELFHAREIDLDIVVDITIVEILETRDGAVYTVDAEVSEFVFGTGTRSRIGDVVVSRSVDEKNLLRLGIYDHQDVNVASFGSVVFFS